MMKKPLLFAGLITLFLITMGCKEEFDPYAPPTWLKGKIYQQLQEREELSTFVKLVDQHEEYSDILKRTSLLTVFAPTDEAFTAYFSEQGISGIDALSLAEKRALVESHIIFDAWNAYQLTITDEKGKIDENTERDVATAFKKRTAYIDSARIVSVADGKYFSPITRSAALATSERHIIPITNKYAPIFYQGFFDEYRYTSADYKFYFDRDFGGGDDVHYAGAKIIERDIPAENGFVHVIDRVVAPLPTLEQKMENSIGSNADYSKVLDLIRSYPYIIYNESETKSQPGYDEGLVDTELYNLFYAFQIGIDISNERIGRFSTSTGDQTTINHYGMVTPTNLGLDKLLTQITGSPKFRTLGEMPDRTKFVLINSMMSGDPIFEKDIVSGFVNMEQDSVYVNESEIVDKEFCSNGTFIGVNEAIFPRAFASVAGPLYLYEAFQSFGLLAEDFGVLSAMKNPNQKLTAFLIRDSRFQEDSSLFIDERILTFNFSGQAIQVPLYKFYYYDRTAIPATRRDYSDADLGRFLNMICEGEPQGIADYEWLKTLAGNYVLFDNVNNTVSGSDATTHGISDSTISSDPKLLDYDPDNGRVYTVESWLNFSTVTSLFTTLKIQGKTGTGTSNYFYELMNTAGLVDEIGSKYSFISDGQFYTVFLPSDAALQEYEETSGVNLKNLPRKELEQFIRYHFVQGELLFTDGKKPSGEYRTLRIGDGSGTFKTYYSNLNIELYPDEINVLDNDGASIVTVRPQSGKSNIITYTMLSAENVEDGATYLPHYASGIVHSIDQVLLYEEE